MKHLPNISTIEAAMASIGIIDRVSNRAVSLFKVALLESFGNTHLPEMYEVLGKDAFLKLVDVFENSTLFRCPHCTKSLRFPTIQQMAELIQDVAVYLRLVETPKGNETRIVKELASQWGTTAGKIRAAFFRMERRAKKYEISLKP